MLTTLDTEDAATVADLIARRDRQAGPRVGDFLIHAGGMVERFSYDWGADIQTSEGGSFHLGREGGTFSGGLNEAVLKTELIDTGELREGRFWIFHHGHQRAHNGVTFTIPCRVYRLAVDPAAPVLCVSWHKATVGGGVDAGQLLTRCKVEAANVAGSKRMNYYKVEVRPHAPA